MNEAEQSRAAAVDRSLLRWVESSGQTWARLGDQGPQQLDIGDHPLVTTAEIDQRWTYLEALGLVEFKGSMQVRRLRVKLTANGVRCLAECDGDVREWTRRTSPTVNQSFTATTGGGDLQMLVDSPGATQHQQRIGAQTASGPNSSVVGNQTVNGDGNTVTGRDTSTRAAKDETRQDGWWARWRKRGLLVGIFTIVGGAVTVFGWIGWKPWE